MSSNSVTGSHCYLLLLIIMTGMTILSGCTSLFTSPPQQPYLCNNSDCHTIILPDEAYTWYSLSTAANEDDKSISRIFSKNITINFSSFSEDLSIAKKRYAPMVGKGTGSTGSSSSVQFINETNAIVNISVSFRSSEEICRDVPFVKEDGIWKIDLSPKFI